MQTPSARTATAVACGLTLALAAAWSPVQATGTSRIVFTQPHVNADGTLQSSSLSLTSGGGASMALTKAAKTSIDDAASWAPDGTRIVFEHGVTGAKGQTRFSLYTLDARTRKLTRRTPTTDNSVTPTWGPTNRIAYVARHPDGDCLAVVEESGRRHDLFCPSEPAVLMRPTWSRDGTSIRVQGGYDTGGLEPTWRSLAYRVDATTGAPYVLDDRILDEPRRLEFSPDGRRGIYYNFYPYAGTMTRVDFATGSSIDIGTGYAPRWAPDGRRIAYTGEVYDSSAGRYWYYEPLYVANADGSGARRLTISRTANHAYVAAQWSKDNVHVLATRRDYLDESLTVPRYGLRIVNADTRSLRSMQEGLADSGAWFER
jgi:Tol biopolymer transport system component